MEEITLEDVHYRTLCFEDSLQSSLLTIITMGNSGSGKSSVINKLFGFQLCPVNKFISQSGLVYQIESSQGTTVQVIDTSGPFCEHENSLSPSNETVIENFIQAHANNLPVILYVIKATENRLCEGNFVQTLTKLKSMYRPRSKFKKIFIVITCGLALGTEPNEFNRELDILIHEISLMVKSVFEEGNVPIIVVENYPQKYNFHDFSQPPNMNRLHANPMKTILQTFEKNKDNDSLQTLAWFAENKCSEDCVVSTMTLQDYSEIQEQTGHQQVRRRYIAYGSNINYHDVSCDTSAGECNKSQEKGYQHSNDNSHEPLLSTISRNRNFQAVTRKILVLAINYIMITLSISLAMYFITSKNGSLLDKHVKEKSAPVQQVAHMYTGEITKLTTLSALISETVEPAVTENVTNNNLLKYFDHSQQQQNSFLVSLTINLTENNDWILRSSHQNFSTVLELRIVGQLKRSQLSRLIEKFVTIRRLSVRIDTQDNLIHCNQNMSTVDAYQKKQLYYLSILSIEYDNCCGDVIRSITESFEFPSLQSFEYEKGIINNVTCDYVSSVIKSYDNLNALSFSKSEWHVNCFARVDKPIYKIVQLKVDMLYGQNATINNFQNALLIFPYLENFHTDFGYINWDEVSHFNITNRIKSLKVNIKLPQGRTDIDISDLRVFLPELRNLHVSLLFHKQRERKPCKILGYLSMQKTLNTFNIMSNCQTLKL